MTAVGEAAVGIKGLRKTDKKKRKRTDGHEQKYHDCCWRGVGGGGRGYGEDKW